ncbi:response regulator [Candidatus Saccharibacteria bacterium]|nr:response regulator [Candidatus Saccharibacteria bacterium]NIW77957.1 response regulator [Calditrichia bacterium]
MKKHDGYVLIQSVENRGTSCKVFFPLSAKQPSEPIVESDEEIIEGEGTILIIDDEKYLREVFKSMIKLMGYNFIEAANGKEAVEVYKANKDRVDLVILDYAMPGLNGKQTYYLLKKLNPNIRVILCTGYSEQKKIWELTRHENVEFLPKPFTIETLSKRIHSLLDAASARKKSISTGNGRTET